MSVHVSEGGEAIVSAQSVDLHLDLGALVLGNIEISELTLVAPELQVGPLLEGIASFGERERAPARPGVLRRIDAHNAKLVFDHPFHEGTLTASDVDLQITASTLTGRYKVNGSYGPRGEGVERLTFTSSVGAIDRGGTVKIAGRIGFDVGEASFDGSLDGLATTSRYRGRLKLERKFASSEEGEPGRITLETDAELSSGLADLAEVKLTAADGAQALTFTGTGRASFEGAPRFSADLNARQIDLDATLGDSHNDALAREIRDMSALLARITSEHEVRGRLQLGVGGAIWRGELMRDISAAVEISPGTVAITNLRSSLPGETNVSLSGKVDLTGAPRFEGNLVAETLEAGRLVRWVAPEHGDGLGEVLGRSRGKYSINGKLSADETSLTLDAVDGFADGNPFSGSFLVELDEERPRGRTDLAFDLIALDRYLPADAKPADLFSRLTGPQLNATTDWEIVIDARAKRVTWRGREAKGVEIGLISADGGIDIVGFNIGRFAGATVSAEGHVRPSPDGPLGALQVGLEALDLSSLLRVFDIDTPGFMGVSPSLREVDLVLSIDNVSSDQGSTAEISASGEIADTSVEISASSDAPLADFTNGALKLAANLEASEAGHIIGPGGLLPLTANVQASGAGRVSVSGEGRLSDKLEFVLLAEAFGGILKGDGHVAGGDQARANLSLGADQFGPVAGAFGLSVPDIAAVAPIRVDAIVEGTTDRLTIELEEGVVAGARVAGTAAIASGAPRKIDLEFESSRLSLPWIASAVFAKDSVASDEKTAQASLVAAWPTELIDTWVFNGTELSVSGKTERLYLGPAMKLHDAEFALAISNGSLHVTRLDGGLGDGNVAISGQTGVVDQSLQVEGEIELRGISLERVIVDGKGRGLAGGRANFESDFSASGRSLLSLVASLEGTGTFAVTEPKVTRFDAATL
ncbi:MAG: hypothetical protein HKN60_02860, partial [Rhizobiales bacterium]|nr:hypothetical protein [Hyphomicrobiales bacterium]